MPFFCACLLWDYSVCLDILYGYRFTMALNRALICRCSMCSPTTPAIQNVSTICTPSSDDNSIQKICLLKETDTDNTPSIPSTASGESQVDLIVTNFTVNCLNLHDFLFCCKNTSITFIKITEKLITELDFGCVWCQFQTMGTCIWLACWRK